eukprot:373484-Pelagomonas_calceolata.AAC.1
MHAQIFSTQVQARMPALARLRKVDKRFDGHFAWTSRLDMGRDWGQGSEAKRSCAVCCVSAGAAVL